MTIEQLEKICVENAIDSLAAREIEKSFLEYRQSQITIQTKEIQELNDHLAKILNEKALISTGISHSVMDWDDMSNWE